jgi:hypothetical protein
MRLVTPILILALTIVAPEASLAAAGVRPLFDLSTPATSPFPSDRFTVSDPSHITGVRVNLPKPDCAIQRSECEDVDLLNELDGFNIRPRLSVPFSGPIDVSTVSSQTVFLVNLGNTQSQGRPSGRVVGIDQVIWDVATNTLYMAADEQLDQHTRYALVVTRGVRDVAGNPIERAEPFRDLNRPLKLATHDAGLIRYTAALMSGIAEVLSGGGVAPQNIAAVSVFTTKSVTAIIQKLRDHVRAADAPRPADFLLGNDGSRTVFPLDEIATATFNRQDRAGDTSPLSPLSLDSRLALLRLFPGAVAHVAFGRYQSPNYLMPGGNMPPFGTATGTPTLLGTNEMYFNLFLPADTPATPRPANGWPVVIFMPGSPDNKNGGPFNVAATFAAHGMASISITAMGLGFGPRSTLTVVTKSGRSISFLAGGRSLDQNGDGVIGAGEGIQVEAPRRTLRNAHTTRQTVADLLQLVRVIETGIDVDGDGIPDLDSSRMYYAGFSAGPNFGTPLLVVEPRLRAGVLTVPAAGLEYGRLSPVNRPGFGSLLDARVPSLINAGGLISIGGVLLPPPFFNENLPQDGEPPVVNTVPGAIAIQEIIDRAEWLGASPALYAPYLRRTPLPGIPVRPILIQLTKGDYQIPNPSTAAMLRAGDLADVATLYRHDRAYAADPTRMKDPHTFLIRTDTANMRSIALAAQRQVATFLASDGVEVINPDSIGGNLFEVPISLNSLEELHELAYIP